MSSAVPIIHVVDDDSSYRTAIGRLIEASGFRFAGYESGSDFLARLPVREPGCVLLDLQMPDIDGLELQGRLAEAAPHLPIVFLTGHGDIASTVLAMKAGAEDFLEKSAPPEALLAAINRGIVLYRTRLSDQERIAELRNRVATLTPRESVVFGLVVRGKRNKQVAYELGTSDRTVKAHRRNVMEKLNARSLAELVSIAERLGLTDDKAVPGK
jgi:FixJ family two-component response regulator